MDRAAGRCRHGGEGAPPALPGGCVKAAVRCSLGPSRTLEKLIAERRRDRGAAPGERASSRLLGSARPCPRGAAGRLRGRRPWRNLRRRLHGLGVDRGTSRDVRTAKGTDTMNAKMLTAMLAALAVVGGAALWAVAQDTPADSQRVRSAYLDCTQRLLQDAKNHEQAILEAEETSVEFDAFIRKLPIARLIEVDRSIRSLVDSFPGPLQEPTDWADDDSSFLIRLRKCEFSSAELRMQIELFRFLRARMIADMTGSSLRNLDP